MKLHPNTFEYHWPSDSQMLDMTKAREAAATYANLLEALLPEGADKTYIMRSLRTVAMWVNTALTRNADGTPR